MKDSLNVSVQRTDDYAVIVLEGYLNQNGGEKLAEVCHQLMDEGVRHLAFDFENVPMVNSIGIAILIEIIERSRELNGKIHFFKTRDVIARTFRIMGLTQFATIFPDRESAIQAFTSDE